MKTGSSLVRLWLDGQKATILQSRKTLGKSPSWFNEKAKAAIIYKTNAKKGR